MSRRPNKRSQIVPPKGAHVLVLKPHERAQMKHYDPPETGSKLGGAQTFCNFLLETTNPESGICTLTDCEVGRLIRYCQSTASGGPNDIIRAVFIPVLRRANIDVLPQWRAPIDQGTPDVTQPSAH